MLLVDLNAGFQASDAQLMQMLSDRGILVNLVLTKCDKIKPKILHQKAKDVIQKVQDKGYLGGVLSPLVHLTSTYTGYGVHELMCGIA